MNRPLLLIFAVMFSGTAIAAGPLTPAERSQVAQLASQSEQTCITGLSNKVNLTEGPFGITQDYVKRYCGCIRTGIPNKIDAQMLRHGTEADGQRFLQSVAQDCAVAEFKTNFPKQCKLMFEGLPPGPSGKASEEDIADACGCVQKAVAKVSGAQLNEVTRQTIQEYQAYKRDQNYEPTLPLSLMGAFKSCFRQRVTSK